MTKPHLAPCTACARHVRVSEAACPFCGAALEASVRNSAPKQAPTVRLSRAALLAFGALGTGALGIGPLTTVAGCSSSTAGPASTVGTAVPYGLPPIPDGGEADGTVNALPFYGIAPQPDAGGDAAGDGGNDRLDAGNDSVHD